jgi:radical SAM superfamily enzyme YgiQ (UPF0313 family)
MNSIKNKLVLVFPPYSIPPTSPPLGVCLLKGFVQRTLPGWSAKVLDLNLDMHEDFFRNLSQRRCLPPKEFPEGLLGEIALSYAGELFRGGHNDEFFGRADRYTLCAELWLRLMHREVGAIPQVLRQAFEDKIAMPALIDNYAQRALDQQPGVVGISLCYSQQVWAGLCLARAIRKRSSVPVVLGGTFFNHQANAEWALRNSDADFVIVGEGEQALAGLLANGLDPEGLPGVYYRREGQPVGVPPAFATDLDHLGSPDFSDLDLRAYFSPMPVLPVLTSRGCYWRRCAFCVHYRSAGLTYRRRSVAGVVEEFRQHVARGVRHFAVIDEMLSPADFGQLAQAIIEAGLKIFYYACAKPVKQFDRELLGRIHQSGCRYVLWGVESGSQRVLDMMDKGTKVQDVEAVLESAHAAGIRNHVYIMPGFPTETREEFQETLDLLARHKQAVAAVHRSLFSLEKDSPVYDNPAKYSITRSWPAGQTPDSDACEFECSSGMTRQEAQQAFAQATPFFRGFYHYSTYLSYLRDHAILVYGRPEQL